MVDGGFGGLDGFESANEVSGEHVESWWVWPGESEDKGSFIFSILLHLLMPQGRQYDVLDGFRCTETPKTCASLRISSTLKLVSLCAPNTYPKAVDVDVVQKSSCVQARC